MEGTPMSGRVMLETDRLVLREHTEADGEVVFRLGSDPELIRFTHDTPFTTVEQAVEVLRLHPMADYQKYGYGRWACVLKETGEVIGFAGLKYLADLDGEVDVGYRFLRTFWGRGL